MSLRELIYGAYERRLAASLPSDRRPKHIGVILDGNRRWARTMGIGVSSGHRRGADKISEFLGWCDELGVEVVTLWLLSTDNLSRAAEELEQLLEIIGAAVTGLAATKRWRINPVGALDLLPDETTQLLKSTADSTRDINGMTVNVAIGYGGRQEIADAVRALLQEQASRGASIEELAQVIDIEHIAAHLYTRGQPDPDLVIRTSGEQRLSGFLLWQSVHSELFFCEAYWPDFRKVDFLRAVRSYVDRDRRFGV
jgi:short-chain Z-isoprenyl diphosphate synthase